eukprot:Opistho-1_new@109467
MLKYFKPIKKPAADGAGSGHRAWEGCHGDASSAVCDTSAKQRAAETAHAVAADVVSDDVALNDDATKRVVDLTQCAEDAVQLSPTLPLRTAGDRSGSPSDFNPYKDRFVSLSRSLSVTRRAPDKSYYGGRLIVFDRQVPTADRARLLTALCKLSSLRQHEATLFGQTHPQPRLSSLHADTDVSGRYTNSIVGSNPWVPELLELKGMVERTLGQKFNSAVVNFYRDGRDHVGMHSDYEDNTGPNPTIASVSLGATRDFVVKRREGDKRGRRSSEPQDWDDGPDRLVLPLRSGTMLVMQGSFNSDFKHGVPPRAGVAGPRINVTFRQYIKRSPN